MSKCGGMKELFMEMDYSANDGFVFLCCVDEIGIGSLTSVLM